MFTAAITSSVSLLPRHQLAAKRRLTFLLVEGGQDAVVPAHLEVNLLLHVLGDGALGDDDADARLDGAQDPSVTVENPPGRGHHRVSFVLVVVVQRAGAEGRGTDVSIIGQNSDGSDRCRGRESRPPRTEPSPVGGAVITLGELPPAAQRFSPDRDGLGNGVDVIVLVFGPVVHGAREGVQTAVVVRGLRRQRRLPPAGLPEELRLHLRVVGQQVVVELGALKLALEGPGGAAVRLGDVAVVARRSAQRLRGRRFDAIDRGFVGEAPGGQVAARGGVISAGRPESWQLGFRIG